MRRHPLKRTAALRRTPPPVRRTPLRRTALRAAPGLGASEDQRAKVAGQSCLVCGRAGRVDAAHLIPRSLGGCDEPACCVPLCRACHRRFDCGELDLLPWLERGWRRELAHAVAHAGLLGALRQLTGRRELPDAA